jgi:hypothetical protein
LDRSIPQVPEKPVLDVSNDNDKNIIPLQLKTTMQNLNDALNEGILDFQSTLGEKQEAFVTMRFYLLASALAFEQNTNSFLGPHEINLLFLHREKLDLAPIEYKLLFRTLIGGPRDTIPGWYWFSKWDPDGIYRLLFYLAIGDKNQDVRINAITLLRDARIRPNPSWINNGNIIELLLNTGDSELTPQILSYILEVGIRDDIALIDNLFKPENESMYRHALAAKLSIISREDPNEGLTQILQLPSDIISEPILSMLREEASELKSHLLEEALDHSNSAIRV